MTNPEETATAKTTIHARVIGADPVAARPASTATALWKHASGRPLVQSAALITGLGLAPLLLEQLQYDVFRTASFAARAAAPPVPAGTDPTLWPPTVASAAWLTGALVVVLALTGVKVSKPVPLVLGLVLLVTTAFGAWSMIDVVNTQAWALLPPCAACVDAFVMAARALQRWQRPHCTYGSGSALSATLLVWAVVLVLLVGGTAIATEAMKSAGAPLAPASSAQRSLDSVRAETAGALGSLRGAWVPQVASAEVHDQAGADAHLAKHHEWAARYAVVLVRGGDFPSQTLGPEDWLTLVNQRLDSEAAVQHWCAGQGLGPNDCLPRQIVAG
jgi:hypothetical protein